MSSSKIKLMKIKKCNAIWIMLVILVAFNNSIKSQTNEKPVEIYKKAIKLRTTFGASYRQYAINPSYCIISKKYEYSFGILYRDLQYRYLVIFKKVVSPMKFYGVKLGYINNVKSSDGVKLRFETNFALAVTTAHAIINNEYIKLNNVYSVNFEFGPNLKIPILKNLDFDFLFQIGYTQGTHGSSKYIFNTQYPSGNYLSPVYYLDINYKF